MKKLILSVVAAVALATPALAADLKLKAPPPPPPPPNPWDFAFGAGIQSDYIFRGITQSNHKPSVKRLLRAALQRHAVPPATTPGSPAPASRSRTGPRPRLTATAGIRPTFGPLALDFGGLYYWYPGGSCFNGSTNPVFRRRLPRERLPAGQRQRHQEGPDLLGGVRQGHLHGE